MEIPEKARRKIQSHTSWALEGQLWSESGNRPGTPKEVLKISEKIEDTEIRTLYVRRALYSMGSKDVKPLADDELKRLDEYMRKRHLPQSELGEFKD